MPSVNEHTPVTRQSLTQFFQVHSLISHRSVKNTANELMVINEINEACLNSLAGLTGDSKKGNIINTIKDIKSLQIVVIRYSLFTVISSFKGYSFKGFQLITCKYVGKIGVHIEVIKEILLIALNIRKLGMGFSNSINAKGEVKGVLNSIIRYTGNLHAVCPSTFIICGKYNVTLTTKNNSRLCGSNTASCNTGNVTLRTAIIEEGINGEAKIAVFVEA